MKEEKYRTRYDMISWIDFLFRDKLEEMTDEELIVQLEYFSGGEDSAVLKDGLFLLTEPMEDNVSNENDKALDRYVCLATHSVDQVVVYAKLDDEGVVVEAVQDGEVIASTYKFYSEMGVELKEVDYDD